MSEVNYIQIVPLTWEERFKMYMKCTKKELASMMAERDKYSCPEACAECVKPLSVGETTTYEANNVTASTIKHDD